MDFSFIDNTGLFYLINGINNPFLDFIMPFISSFGSFLVWFILSIILFIFGGEKGKNVAILAIIALILTYMVTGLLKYVVAEPRPFVTLENVRVLTNEVLGYYSSFPSGHTSGSFAFTVIVGLKYYLNILGKKLRLIYPLLIFAALVGFSRIYIGVHYPLDVIFGAIIGIACAIIILKLENKILSLIHHKKKPPISGQQITINKTILKHYK